MILPREWRRKQIKPRRPMNWLAAFRENVPDDPFYLPRKPLWLPPEMSAAPELPPPALRKPAPRTALRAQPAPAALIDQRRIGEPVRKHDLARGQGRHDPLVHVLRAAGEIQDRKSTR